MCACSNYSSFDKILCYAATTTIWHYFISFSIHSINPVAEILHWDSIGIKLGWVCFVFFCFVSYKIIIHPLNPTSWPATQIAATQPLSKGASAETKPHPEDETLSWGFSWAFRYKGLLFPNLHYYLAPAPKVNHHILLGSLCHDSSTKIKQERPIQGQDPIFRWWGKRNS